MLNPQKSLAVQNFILYFADLKKQAKDKQPDNLPLSSPANGKAFVDYSVMYREKEIRQLGKRLRRTRNILLLSAVAFIGGGLVFWIMPELLFKTRNFLYYIAMAIILIGMAFLSRKKPYMILLSALVICIGYWGLEIIMGSMDNLLIEGAIHKLCIISLMISGIHTSREAELIKKELHFS